MAENNRKKTGERYGRMINTTSTSGIYGNVRPDHYAREKAGHRAFTSPPA